MKILKSIGAFFVAIWRWIKNTAWVQPLLIVGAIFGVIFSIPSITNGIKGLINSKNSADTFFASFKLSMEGGATSQAETLMQNYADYKDPNVKKPLKKEEEKYFLFFTKTGDTNANATKKGFEIAKDNWNSSFTIKDKREFKLYTIFTDEKTNQTTADQTAFAQLINRKSWFFEEAAANAQKSDYFLNKKITKDQLEKLATCEASSFTVPTIMLIDWTDEAKKTAAGKPAGVTQVMFSLDGTDDWAKAQKLVDCWNSEGDFGPSKA